MGEPQPFLNFVSLAQITRWHSAGMITFPCQGSISMNWLLFRCQMLQPVVNCNWWWCAYWWHEIGWWPATSTPTFPDGGGMPPCDWSSLSCWRNPHLSSFSCQQCCYFSGILTSLVLGHKIGWNWWNCLHHYAESWPTLLSAPFLFCASGFSQPCVLADSCDPMQLYRIWLSRFLLGLLPAFIAFAQCLTARL